MNNQVPPLWGQFNPRTIVLHHASKAQVEELTIIFAKPFEQNGGIEWKIPQWLMDMHFFARH